MTAGVTANVTMLALPGRYNDGIRPRVLRSLADPNAQGQLTLQMISAAGVDLKAPSFFTAAKACVGVTHGAITLPDVARAVDGPH